MAESEKRPLKVFLCYASADREAVRMLYNCLISDGIDAWFDQEKLLPGQSWREEIPKALIESDVAIICLSNNSITKTGFVQKEINYALGVAEEMPEGRIYLIPAKLEECQVPERLCDWQWVDLFEKDGYERLIHALVVQAERIGTVSPHEGSKFIFPQLEHSLKEHISTSGVSVPLAKSKKGCWWIIVAVPLLIFLLIIAIYFFQKFLINTIVKATPTPTFSNSLDGTATSNIVTEKATPTSTPALPKEFRDQADIPMILIPAGEFTMGRSDSKENEKPAHPVFLDDYYIDKYEVTNEAYAACEAEGVCKPPFEFSSRERAEYYNSDDYRNFPVIHVNWEMANTYCEWRGAHLPTEAEWEKAARGDDENIKFYPWGDGTGCTFGNFAACTRDTTEVGSYPEGKSPYGVYDMAGNVWEWVADWYGYNYYELSPHDNPKGPDTGDYRGLRGGSWNNPSAEVRVTYRVRYYPFITSFNLGFRCARSVNP